MRLIKASALIPVMSEIRQKLRDRRFRLSGAGDIEEYQHGHSFQVRAETAALRTDIDEPNLDNNAILAENIQSAKELFIAALADRCFEPNAALDLTFDINFYSDIIGEHFDTNDDGFAHFCEYGLQQGISPHPLISVQYLLDRGILKVGEPIHSVFQTISQRILNNQRLCPYFEPSYYLAKNRDVAEQFLPAHIHFQTTGVTEGRQPNQFISLPYLQAEFGPFSEYYDALKWYIRLGDRIGAPPSLIFDPVQYCNANPDVALAQIPALYHFLATGRQEGRSAVPLSLPTSNAEPESDHFIASEINCEQLVTDYYIYKNKFEDMTAKGLKNSRDVFGLEPQPKSYDAVPSIEEVNRLTSTKLAAAEAAQVALIVPVYGEKEATVKCIYSILHSTNADKIHIYIFDDCSPGSSFEDLSTCGVTVKRNTANLGFLKNVNKNLAHVLPDTIFLLNNDTVLEKNAVSLLYDHLHEQSYDVVGPKVIYPSGVLQEAGGSLDQHGNPMMVGLNESPHAPAYNYARPVPYISGVAIMFKKTIFNLIKRKNLFNPVLAPAYCEDVELGLRVNRFGGSVSYLPEAKIWHTLSLTSNKISSHYKVVQSKHNNIKVKSISSLSNVFAAARPKIFAFYLPQFHETHENNKWWGKGFTEWTNVGKSLPLFEGHRQPRVPLDLGYYNLSDPNVIGAQYDLAKRYNVDGFVFYSYYFNGRKVLNTPIDNLIRQPNIKAKFMLCWANEPWTRAWDGKTKDVLLPQTHSEHWLRNYVLDHKEIFTDHRYVRMNGATPFLVYRPSLMSSITGFASIIKSAFSEIGINNVKLLAVDAMERAEASVNPCNFGFDGSVVFPPHNMGEKFKSEIKTSSNFAGNFYDLDCAYKKIITDEYVDWVRYPGIFTGWDNSPRRGPRGDIFIGESPGKFQAALETLIHRTCKQHPLGERAVFINAWNEWAEGTYLEPDSHFGHMWLEAVKNATRNRY